MHNVSTLTPAQIKQRLRTQGITITQWAQDRGYARRDVYRVLNGQLKANFGRAHQIAVDLGLKQSDASSKGSTAPCVGNTKAGAHA
ncbi:DNA-binding protein [Tahibacter soli]|uniref:DNA-binding protein n=1 Tax=Tahibacter soli TaxID=2983605 RepID=A0A9X3YIQ7_9GAMM|nr:DNA-binding protein [Tahibacter soli]MDC8012259.1 DNA-binding protein [Tahibacter soli]